MQADKFTVTIKVEVLSIDVVPGLLIEVAKIMEDENKAGYLSKEDGDSIKWETVSEKVNF